MTGRHFSDGDEFPPLKTDLLRLYNMRWCPFAQRTRLVLEHKQIPHETININLYGDKKPSWFKELAPLGMVPVLELNGQVIYESAICSEYLDEAYPNPPLFPKDPLAKAQIKVLMEHYSKVVPKFYAIRKVTGEERQAILLEMQVLLERFENELFDNKFFGGEGPNMLDYHMYPWFERVPYMHLLLPKEKLPRLNIWLSSMQNCPTVKAIAETITAHQLFIDSYTNGKVPNLDIEA